MFNIYWYCIGDDVQQLQQQTVKPTQTYSTFVITPTVAQTCQQKWMIARVEAVDALTRTTTTSSSNRIFIGNDNRLPETNIHIKTQHPHHIITFGNITIVYQVGRGIDNAVVEVVNGVDGVIVVSESVPYTTHGSYTFTTTLSNTVALCDSCRVMVNLITTDRLGHKVKYSSRDIYTVYTTYPTISSIQVCNDDPHNIQCITTSNATLAVPHKVIVEANVSSTTPVASRTQYIRNGCNNIKEHQQVTTTTSTSGGGGGSRGGVVVSKLLHGNNISACSSVCNYVGCVTRCICFTPSTRAPIVLSSTSVSYSPRTDTINIVLPNTDDDVNVMTMSVSDVSGAVVILNNVKVLSNKFTIPALRARTTGASSVVVTVRICNGVDQCVEDVSNTLQLHQFQPCDIHIEQLHLDNILRYNNQIVIPTQRKHVPVSWKLTVSRSMCRHHNILLDASGVLHSKYTGNVSVCVVGVNNTTTKCFKSTTSTSTTIPVDVMVEVGEHVQLIVNVNTSWGEAGACVGTTSCNNVQLKSEVLSLQHVNPPTISTIRLCQTPAGGSTGTDISTCWPITTTSNVCNSVNVSTITDSITTLAVQLVNITTRTTQLQCNLTVSVSDGSSSSLIYPLNGTVLPIGDQLQRVLGNSSVVTTSQFVDVVVQLVDNISNMFSLYNIQFAYTPTPPMFIGKSSDVNLTITGSARNNTAMVKYPVCSSAVSYAVELMESESGATIVASANTTTCTTGTKQSVIVPVLLPSSTVYKVKVKVTCYNRYGAYKSLSRDVTVDHRVPPLIGDGSRIVFNTTTTASGHILNYKNSSIQACWNIVFVGVTDTLTYSWRFVADNSNTVESSAPSSTMWMLNGENNCMMIPEDAIGWLQVIAHTHSGHTSHITTATAQVVMYLPPPQLPSNPIITISDESHDKPLRGPSVAMWELLTPRRKQFNP